MWTPAELVSEAHPWKGSCWRVVEAQSQVSTMKLVDTLDDQTLLEQILDRSKPLYPSSCKNLPYLLYTPFRYWPYPNGSRFRRAGQTDGCLYASAKPETAIAEQAFFRWRTFFVDAPGAQLPTNALEQTAFCFSISSNKALDLTASPLNRDAQVWMHPTNYGPCQELADFARQASIDFILYSSVRDPDHGINFAVFSPGSILPTRPEVQQTWKIFLRLKSVQVFREIPRSAIQFDVQNWDNDSRVHDVLSRNPDLADLGKPS